MVRVKFFIINPPSLALFEKAEPETRPRDPKISTMMTHFLSIDNVTVSVTVLGPSASRLSAAACQHLWTLLFDIQSHLQTFISQFTIIAQLPSNTAKVIKNTRSAPCFMRYLHLAILLPPLCTCSQVQSHLATTWPPARRGLRLGHPAGRWIPSIADTNEGQ
jgi:hypothetical protein